MHLGKQIRLERIVNRNNGRTIIVPMDHGVSLGSVPGLIDMKRTVDDMARGGADAVLMHKGLIRCSFRRSGIDIGLIVHLSASTELSPRSGRKSLVGTVEEAMRHGADCVSCHVNLGDPSEEQMLADLGRVAERCGNWGMPLVAMMYGRGSSIKDSYAPEVVAHCARSASSSARTSSRCPTRAIRPPLPTWRPAAACPWSSPAALSWTPPAPCSP